MRSSILEPSRLACLSAESADVCARIGAWERVVGVSSYADQADLPQRPVISGFSKANVPQVLALRPDLVFTFSDVQAEIAAELIRGGCTVVATNPRSLQEIAGSIRLISRAVGFAEEGERLAEQFLDELESLRREPARRPRVYFEEWPEPLVSGIAWVGELIEWTGGHDLFAARRGAAAKERVLRSEEVIDAQPEIILASWCGKPVDIGSIARRPGGWDRVPAVREGRVFELPSADVLQPGPRLVRGAREMAKLFREWDER